MVKLALAPQNGSVIERSIKPTAGKVAGTAMQFINGISFDPHPRRTSLIRAAKVGIPAFLAGGLVLGKMLKS